MTKREVEFDGTDIVLVNKETGEKVAVGKSIKGDKAIEKEEVKFLDDKFDEEIDEETLEELEQVAKEHLDSTTDEEVGEVLGEQLQDVINLAEAYEELKKNYIRMQEEADKRVEGDGGEDKTNPDYYKTRELESIEIMELKHGTRATMAFCILTSERYEYRVGNKQIQEGNAQLDIEKADWYLEKYLELRDKVGTETEVFGLSTILSGF